MRPIYAGIGSRQTPTEMLALMNQIGEELAADWMLRSGYAHGADRAFSDGAMLGNGEMQLFLPWAGYNDAPRSDPRFVVPTDLDRLMELASRYHPGWDRCSPGVKKLHARNGCQILGLDLQTPADMVVCWTPGGRAEGGTGQAIRLARDHAIPVFDLALADSLDKLVGFVRDRRG